MRGRAGITISQQPIPSAESDPLAQLYKYLIAPIAQDLPSDPNQRVIFLPQGELFLVPFAALPDAQGRPLIEKHTISIAPSIQTLALTQTLAKRPKASGAVIVGDPKMPTYNGQPLSSLPAARQEAIAIGQQLNTPPLIGSQATKAAVLQQMPSARLLHFATHGLLDPVQGDIPGAIALAPSGQDNGFLSAAEIFNLKLNADLVVLSACDTGQGEITGDGVVGLSRSFIAAGAPSVVVSLWAVNDQSASELMQEFYRQLKQQPDKAQALRQAMLITKQRYPAPSHWAAFTLVGER
ncbi:CHAT domain-containing protein [Alkalinema pantanalense CENA528]|uniref:CHAT domain-containing protein n=1 Tax=Alkalinema pantanalense TaxID=1620705 RepID=UPI003D6E25BC